MAMLNYLAATSFSERKHQYIDGRNKKKGVSDTL